MRIRDRLGISRERQRQAAWLMELSLVGFVFVGIDRGGVGIIVNSLVGLAVTQIPPLMERDYDLTMDPALVLWITTAVFLHALGTLGPYQDIWWWDHLTHGLSSSLVAAAGYAFARAVDEHVDDVHLPPAFTFAFILLVVLAFGVFWEVIEFVISGVAGALGTGSIITQYGIGDTMLDLVFDTVGGIIVATWGTVYLTDVVGQLGERISGE